MASARLSFFSEDAGQIIVRIWDISPKRLCRNHLLGEHRELHAIWVILTEGKRGYAHHPETLRWRGKLKALYVRHKKLVEEMRRREYNHNSPLNARLATGAGFQYEHIDSYKEQLRIIKRKKCACRIT